MLSKTVSARLESFLQGKIRTAAAMQGGCVADVYHLVLNDKRQYVVKVDAQTSPRLDVEAWMLRYMAAHSSLPVPEVVFSDSDLLVMSHVPGESNFDERAQTHAAELVAALHQVRGTAFGLERDTLIGALRQPNPQRDSWLDFFAEHRIVYMAQAAYQEKVLPDTMLRRLEAFAKQLPTWLSEPKHPSLLHGDLWTSNMLAENGRMTGFLDPAIYYGHPEAELAFTTLFGTFQEPFFKRYAEINPIEEDFFELRLDLYNLYPLLVHVRLFGSSYLSGIDRTLKRIGL